MSMPIYIEEFFNKPIVVQSNIKINKQLFNASFVFYVEKDHKSNKYIVSLDKCRNKVIANETIEITSQIIENILHSDIDIFKYPAIEEIKKSMTEIFAKYKIG
jgi:uncharacterized protein YhbP (UPF0306 family)